MTTCDLCGREVQDTTKHHLIPKSRHTKSVKKKYNEECKTRIGNLCIACHRQVHYMFTHKELERKFNTIHALMEDPQVLEYVEWIRKKPEDFLPSKGKKKR